MFQRHFTYLWLGLATVCLAACGSAQEPSTAPVSVIQQDDPTDNISPPSAANIQREDVRIIEAGFSSAGALVEQGRVLYQRKCGACHSLDQNRVGPRHRGVYGRASAAVPGFQYSAALRKLEIVWTEETLDTWLRSPTRLAPGTSMGFQLSRAEERAAVIAYLKSLNTSD